MTDTDIARNLGQVHSGSGPQFNGTTFVVAEGWLVRRGQDPRRTAKEHLDRLNRQFVEPFGYAMAQHKLEQYGCAILVGQPGVGKRAAGQVLLLRSAGGADVAIQDETGLPQESGGPILPTDHVADGDLILLDPTEIRDADKFADIMGGLPAYQAELRRREATLVVVLLASQVDLVRPELRELMVTLERPDAALVVRRHLAVAEIPLPEPEVLDNDALRERQRSDPMRTLAELVRLVGQARDRLGPGPGFAGWLAKALEALGELGVEVAKQVQLLEHGEQRALLLAAAMLPGAPADQVDFAAVALARAAKLPDDGRSPLALDDLHHRLAALRVTVGRDGRVLFTTFGYEHAVRRHYWDYFATLRDELRNWAQHIAVSADLDARQRDQFTSCFADQVLRTNRPGDIVTVVEAWLRRPAPHDRALPVAALALERGLTDPRHGSLFRRRIYDWSRDDKTSYDKAQLAIALCADVIAVTHPAQAVVRLHHFIRRKSDGVGAAAQVSLLRLVRRDRLQFRRLLDRVVTGLLLGSWDADVTLFRLLAQPAELAPLLTEPVVRQQVVLGWRAVLFGRRPEDWAELAGQWLDRIERGPRSDLWLGVLVDACAQPGPGTGRLYEVTRTWARQPAADHRARNAIALRLTDLMTRAQRAATGVDTQQPSEEPVG